MMEMRKLRVHTLATHRGIFFRREVDDWSIGRREDDV
jgi:hypothetical protein